MQLIRVHIFGGELHFTSNVLRYRNCSGKYLSLSAPAGHVLQTTLEFTCKDCVICNLSAAAVSILHVLGRALRGSEEVETYGGDDNGYEEEKG